VTLAAKVGPPDKAGPWLSRKGELVTAEAWKWDDGAPLWRADFNGLHYPTKSHESLFHQNFGAHDGFVYAVHVKDGSPAWRFLAAPAPRQHMVLGQLESAYPVFNVVLDGGRLYCSAGRHEELENGIHFYCLDAASGALHWHVSRRRGMESDLEPYRQRKNVAGQRGEIAGVFSDGRAQMNDLLELKDGKLRLHGVPLVDVKAPRDDVMYPRTLVPPQRRAASPQ
jgi:hypothetical protein